MEYEGNVIDVADLRKTFGSFVALDGLNLQVAPSEVAGFLGPNGAGKSTTIRVLLGMYRADAGHVRLFGADPLSAAVPIHRRLAYVPGDVSLWPQLTGGECIDLLLGLRGVRGRAKATTEDLIARFELDPTKKSGTYSKGNRQKIALVAALAAPTELLILDEPTSGLDPLMANVFTDLVRQRAAEGTAVLMSSHILSEVEEVCESVTIIRAGKTVQAGTLAQLRHLRRSRVTLTLEGPAEAEQIEVLAGVHDFRRDADVITFTVDDAGLPEFTRTLGRLDVRAVSIQPPSLEELFLHAYDEPLAASS